MNQVPWLGTSRMKRVVETIRRQRSSWKIDGLTGLVLVGLAYTAWISHSSGRQTVVLLGYGVILVGLLVKSLEVFLRQVGIVSCVNRARQLRESEERFKRAVEGSADGLWEYTPATKTVWYTDRFRQLLGFATDEVCQFPPVFESWSQRLHPDDYQRTLAAVEAHLRERTQYDVSYRLRMKSGEYRWFRARGQAIWDERGTPLKMAGSITDIHDQRAVEERLTRAIRAAKQGLWDWCVDSGEAVFNDTLFTMLGYQPGERSMCLDAKQDLVHPDDLPAFVRNVDLCLRGETNAYRSEHRLRRKDGSWHWVLDVGEIVERSTNGEPRRMIGVHIDIDAQCRARVEVEKLNVELADQIAYANSLVAKAEAANVAKSEFLANMSHEIRTPMTAILGYTDLLAEEGDLSKAPPERLEKIVTIRRNAEHLLTIINDILDMSKIEAGKLSVEQIDTWPAQVVEEVVSLMRHRATGKGIDLRVRYDSHVPERITSDPTRLRQILVNLVGNAIKFTEMGSVTIRVALETGADGRQGLRFSVIDTGIGMAPEQRDNIARFDAFNQADGSTTRRFGGSGLGLRISNSLATMLGGNIEVRSELGVGSTFTVAIATGTLHGIRMLSPSEIARGTEQAAAARMRDSATASRNERLDGMRLMLAEDGPDNQRLISFVLKKAGADVTVVENGQMAYDKALAVWGCGQPFDVILMDMQMPIMDGYTATRQLRQAGYLNPIIALTAHAMAEDRQKCLDAGCSDYATKPIDRNQLIALIHQQAAIAAELQVGVAELRAETIESREVRAKQLDKDRMPFHGRNVAT